MPCAVWSSYCLLHGYRFICNNGLKLEFAERCLHVALTMTDFGKKVESSPFAGEEVDAFLPHAMMVLRTAQAQHTSASFWCHGLPPSLSPVHWGPQKAGT